MYAKSLQAAILLLVGLTLGALLGRRWTGTFADSVLTFLALLTAALVIFDTGYYFWKRWRESKPTPAIDPTEVPPEELPRETGARWEPILFLVVALLLAVYAQYLFGQENPDLRIPVVLYAIAMLLFIQVIRQLTSPVLRGPRARTDWWADARAWFRSQPIRNGLFVVAILAGLLGAYDASRVPHPGSYTFAVFAWLLSMAAFAAAFVPWDQARAWHVPSLAEIKATLMPHAGEIVLVTALVVLAFVMRAYDAGNIPISSGGDEAEMGLQALQVLDGRLSNPFATSWYTHPTLFFFLQSLSLRVFGETVLGLRMLSALIGTLTILATYLLVRQLHGRTLAAATAALLAVYPYHIQFSRIGLNNIADPFWAAIVFFLAIRGMVTRHIGYFVGAGFAIGLSQYFYHGVRLVPVMLAIFLLFWLLPEWRTALSWFWHFVVMGIAALLAALPLAFYYIQFPQLFNERLGQMGIFQSGWFAREIARTGQDPIRMLFERTRDRFLLFISIPDLSGFYAPGTPLLETFSAILFVFGLAYAISQLRQRGFFLFVMWFVCGVIFGSVLIMDEAGSARTVTLTVPLTFFVALGIVKLAEIVAALAARPTWRWQIIVGAIALLAVVNIKFYFVDYIPKRTYTGYVGWVNTEMAKYFMEREGDFKAYFFGPPWDYLTHGTIAFMVPHLNGMDIRNPIQGPPNFVDPSRDALFIFIPMRQNEFPIVQDAYPNGTLIDFNMPDGAPLFFIYEVNRQ
jgi:4-amino-4-deoxy-L-arabinose transferase-like glycosyltransferase